MRSDKLPHFVEYDPPAKNYTPAKVKAREELEAQVAAFKARGGQIQEVGSDANRNPHFIIGNVIRPEK